MAFSLSMSIVKSELTAEEAIQDAFLKAFQNLRKFKQKSKFSTWFYRIVVNESLRKIQKKQLEIEKKGAEPEPEAADSSTDGFQALHEIEQKEIIQNVLDELPASDSLLLRLYYLDENNVDEIVEITGLSNSNVKVILHRARLKFYQVLQHTFKHEIRSLL
jgi:RNA polymerase sigma factor (sigma-70 family)